MAEEEQQSKGQDDAGAHEPERGAEAGARDADANEGVSQSAVDESAGPDTGNGGSDEQEPVSPRTVNRVVVDTLTLHYPARDVSLPLDGDAALRVLTMFWRRRRGPHADRLDPETSSALSGWLVLDLDEPLAVSWYPVLGSPSTRTAIDPVPPQAA